MKAFPLIGALLASVATAQVTLGYQQKVAPTVSSKPYPGTSIVDGPAGGLLQGTPFDYDWAKPVYPTPEEATRRWGVKYLQGGPEGATGAGVPTQGCATKADIAGLVAEVRRSMQGQGPQKVRRGGPAGGEIRAQVASSKKKTIGDQYDEATADYDKNGWVGQPGLIDRGNKNAEPPRGTPKTPEKDKDKK